MVNEMARVLTGIPKYTAYAKIVQEKIGGPIVWKGRVQPAKLSSVSAGAPETARLAIEKRAIDYTRPRGEIREEIARRQEKWRRRVSVEAPSERTGEKKLVDALKHGVATLDEEEPPPRMVLTKEGGGLGGGAQAPEDTEKVRLVYRSDFTAPSKEWMEITAETRKVFRRDGCCHIAVNPPGVIVRGPKIAMEDFRVCVDAASVAGRGEDVPEGADFEAEAYGIVFRMEDTKNPSFYCLNIYSRRCTIYICSGGRAWDTLLDWYPSEWIKPPPEMNSWMLEMIADKVTVELNGHALGEIRDSRLKSGFVGVLVSAGSQYSEARFRNFLLYEIDK
jgi:hypothetical protein